VLEQNPDVQLTDLLPQVNLQQETIPDVIPAQALELLDLDLSNGSMDDLATFKL
jgi:hypothetical protein